MPFRFIELEIIMHCSGRAEIANWLCAPGANSTLHMTIFDLYDTRLAMVKDIV